MRKSILLSLLLIAVIQLSAQFEIGIKTGLSSYDLTKNGILYLDNNKNLSLNIENSGFGHHLGLYTRLSVLGVFLEPSFLFNSNTVDYRLREYGEAGALDLIRKERYNYLDIPVMAGIKLGIFRLQGGVVSHIFISSSSELTDIKGYEQKFKNATYGWQAGAGLDIWRFRLDINYEGNLTRFGDHINIGGTPLALETRPSRVIMSLGFRF
jgi:hypothetical protein